MLSDADLEQINLMISEESARNAAALEQTEAPEQAPELCEQASLTLSDWNVTFMDQQSLVRGKLEELLHNYANQHPWVNDYF